MAITPNRSYFGLGIIAGYATDAEFIVKCPNPQRGDFYFNTTLKGLRQFDGTNWRTVTPIITRCVATYIDTVSTVLPSYGSPYSPDGTPVVTGDQILFTDGAINAIYEATVVAGDLTDLTLLKILQDWENGVPQAGDRVYITAGATAEDTEWNYNGTTWSQSAASVGYGTTQDSTLHWDAVNSQWVENLAILQDNLGNVTGAISIKPFADNVADAAPAQDILISGGEKTAGTGDGGPATLIGGASAGGKGGTASLAGGNGVTSGDAVVSGEDVRINANRTIKLNAQGATDPLLPTATEIYYNTVENRFKYFDGTNWRPLGSGGGAYPVNYLSTALTISTTDPYSPDGTPVVVGDEVLFATLTTAADRGVYRVTDITLGVITWTRVIFGQSPLGESFDGDFVWIKTGSASFDQLYVCTDTAAHTWINYAVLAGVGVIGTAEDGAYTDGLFTDFVPTTPIGTAVDRFNEILKALAPAPAPALSDMSMTQTGVASKLSWGTSNAIPSYANVTVAGGGSAVNINGNFDVTGNRKGAFGSATTTFSGTLANAVVQGSGSPNPAYPAKAFGNANQGFLRLLVNGVQVHQVDLSSFGSGTSVNANGSGFTLSAANNALFPDGTPLDLFKNRTGTWTVNVADCGLGMNYFQVEHFITGSALTQKYDLVRDTNAIAMTASGNTLGSLAMAGSKRLSGVNYHTSGTAAYGVTIANAYRNLYSQNPITFTGTNCTVPSQAIPAMATEADNIVISGAVATVTNSGRLLNASISVGVNVPHPLKTALSNAGSSSISGILLDNVSTASTDLVENFDAENIRMQSVAAAGTNNYAAQADVSVGNAWDSTQSLTTGTAGHTDGLLYENSAAKYPTQGTNGGNYSGITNGPAGNVNYSAASGTRYVYMKFRNNTGLTKSNFTINFQGASVTFVDVLTALTGNNMRVEMKFPTGSLSTATGWMDCYKDFATGLFADGDGARLASNGVGRALATTWGITVGTKSIAANEWVMVRFSVGSGWTGNISSLTVAWL